MTKLTAEEKLTSLRAALKKQGVNGFIVPYADEYQSEYTPDYAKRLTWLTGFSGSSGTAVVLEDKAFVSTDGRYALQIKQQVDSALYETNSIIGDSLYEYPINWIAENGKNGQKIGYDPKLMTPGQIEEIKETLDGKGIELVPLESNPVDALWDDQPATPASKIRIFPETIAGRSSSDKRDEIAKVVKEKGGKAFLVTQAASVAWFLNIRGDDIKHTPVALSYAILHDNGDVDWFIDKSRIPPDVQTHLGNSVQICNPATLKNALEQLAQDSVADDKPIMMDFSGTSIWFKNVLEAKGAAVKELKDPCIAPRARKTPEEQQAIKEAHIKDGVALVRFMSWLEKEAPKGTHTEVTVADKLEAFRRMDPDCLDLSFPTIAGWNANGAIVHYQAEEESCATIKGDGLLLVDSGGQYSGGTTDVTRTLAVGKPTQDMKDDFTSVLKGHIGIAKQRFPEGLTGEQIDILARQHLWNDSKGYTHGTGHGVGCNLGVHEAGVGISSRAKDAFAPGMLVSNEPGYYKEGSYGIRIESLLLVEDTGDFLDEGSKEKSLMLKFNTVTMAPIDRNLVNLDLMEEAELAWLNEYHRQVYDTLSPLLTNDPDVVRWLKQACAPLKKNETPGITRQPPSDLRPGP